MSEHDDLDPVLEDRARSLLTLAAETVPVTTLPVAPEPRRPVWPWLAAAAAVAVIAVGLPLLLGSPPRTPTPQPPEPTTGTVPQTLWMTKEQAVATLEDAGYRVELTFPLTCEVEPGRVVNTDPAASESYAPGRAVLVRVARNPPNADCMYGNDDVLGLLDLARFGTGDLPFASQVEVYVEGELTDTLTATEAADAAAWGSPSPLTALVEWVGQVVPTPGTTSIGTLPDRGGQYACGAGDPPAALRDRPSTVVDVEVSSPNVELLVECHWIRVYRDADGRIDVVTSASITWAQEPAGEESDGSVPPDASTELRQYADILAGFAAGSGPPAFAPEVRLLLGNRLVDTVTAAEAAAPATWLLPCEAYGEASCPIDALRPLAAGVYAPTGTVERTNDACHQVDARLPDDLVTAEALARSVSLSVPEPETCAQHWELQVWYDDDSDAIRAVNFIAGMP
jgi:hypothetical protein